ncbi:sensor histidine kinase [Sediminibacterium ginsengisoli]|uniref:PAS domain S-box-containing protein n=1 Tax=Sediminibacterium ginsengisoli TaxID=413434 RepID=A0A1T4R1A9_9BACT|nr:PAS domain S-box protein [Sediminibacterium ginsengisoli]SKA09770.1 PAS domain S-box-containing protein [Sediminibacterium ginsengisoli]
MLHTAEPEIDFFSFFELTLDLVCIAGKDGYLKKINPAVTAVLGYTEDELLNRPIDSFIHPEDLEATRIRRTALLKGKNLVNFENRYFTKTGEVVWLSWTSIFIPSKEVVFAIAKDITERKKADELIEEKYRRFKSMATHFKSSIEEDRKYLAAELHEELAQLAAVIKMDMIWLHNHLPDQPAVVGNRITHATGVADLLINTIRRISFSISPGRLSDLGLAAALKWQCDEFSLLNSIPCVFENNCEESLLSEEIRIDFFRICQEALLNIMYHAQAKTVTVKLEDHQHYIMLSIQDDGIGFDPDKLTHHPGITSMTERTESINGRLVIKSAPGAGTMLMIFVNK